MFKKNLVCLLVVLLISLQGCHKSPPNYGVPNVAVSISIDINLPAYSKLVVPGGCQIVSGGYLNHGIIIYRASNETFYAMDATCTYNNSGFVQITKDGIFAIDSSCGSKFTLVNGGSVEKGPATIGLKNYTTYFDGTYVTVTN